MSKPQPLKWNLTALTPKSPGPQPNLLLTSLVEQLHHVLALPVKDATLTKHETHDEMTLELTVIVSGPPPYSVMAQETEFWMGGINWFVKEVSAYQSVVMPVLSAATPPSIEVPAHPIDTLIKLIGVLPTPTYTGVDEAQGPSQSVGYLDEINQQTESVVEAISSLKAEASAFAVDKEMMGKLEEAVVGELSGPVMFGVQLPTTTSLVGVKIMLSKFDGTCDLCGLTFPKGMPIAWNPHIKARHVGCWLRDRAVDSAIPELYHVAALDADAMTEAVLLWFEEAKGPIATGECDTVSPEACDHAIRCHCAKAPWNRLEKMKPGEVL